MLWFYYVPREFWCDENEQQNDKTSLESEAEIDYGFYFVQKMESLNSLKLIPASFLSIHLAGARVHIHIHHHSYNWNAFEPFEDFSLWFCLSFYRWTVGE